MGRRNKKILSIVLLSIFIFTSYFTNISYAKQISVNSNQKTSSIASSITQGAEQPQENSLNHNDNSVLTANNHTYDPFKEKEFNTDLRNENYSKDTILIKMYEPSGVSRSQAAPFRMESFGITGMEPLFSVTSFVKDAVMPARAPSAGDEAARWYRSEVKEGTDINKTIEELSKQPGVAAVEPDYTRTLSDLGIPNEASDPNIKDQWYLDKIGVKNAWNYLKDEGINPGGSRDVVVAVIDTGVDYNHPELSGSMWINTGEIAGNGIDDDNNGYIDDVYGACTVGNTYAGESGNPMDDNGHGTHVAGIIAAQAQNRQGGVGIAYNVRIMAVKAGQSSGILTASDIAQGIDYARKMGADIINMSFGGYGQSQIEEDALQNAFGTSVLIAAAGNDGLPDRPFPIIGRDMFPAAYPWVLGVMAENPYPAANGDNLAGFSNWDYIPQDSHEYQVMAPGVQIYSTLPGGKYAKWSGTSMATPVVSAIAALVRSKYSDKDVYSSRFIMGQLASTGEMKQGITYDPKEDPIFYHEINAYKALTEIPKPSLSYLEHYLLDSPAISPANNGDGVVDSGEIIDIAMVVRNHWGNADNVKVTLDTKSGAGMEDQYVIFLDGTNVVDYGAVGTFDTDDNGMHYENDVITGVDHPFRIKIAENCPNDHVIPINITITATNRFDEKDTTVYSFGDNFTIGVRNGQKLPGVITSDMTLTSDRYWIIPNATVIERGARVTVEPGAQIQFWSSEPEDPYAIQNMAYLEVRGEFIVNGTAEKPVEMFSSGLFPGYEVKIYSTDYLDAWGSAPESYRGYAEINYAKIMNPNIAVNKIDHCYFSQDLFDRVYKRYLDQGKVYTTWLGPIAYASEITNSRFYGLGFDPSNSNYYNMLRLRGRIIGNLFDSSQYYLDEQYAEDNVFLKNYKLDGQQYGDRNYWTSMGKFFGQSINSDDTFKYSLPIKFNENGSVYFSVNPNTSVFGEEEYKLVEEFAKKFDGTVAIANDIEEENFINSNFYSDYYNNYVWKDSTGSRRNFNDQARNSYIIEVQGISYVTGVYLNTKSLLLGAGGAESRLEATIAPLKAANKNITWTSSNPEVASVDENGVVTPKSIGTAEITVTTEDGNYTDKCEVTVRQIVPATGIILNKSYLKLVAGNTETLIPSVLPAEATNKNVTWSSSDNNVAKVDNRGNVTAAANGTSVITVTAQDGGFTAECTVQVVTPVSGISLNQRFLRLVMDSSPVTLVPHILPENATIKDVKWSSSNTNVAVVDNNGVVTPVGQGTALISAVTLDGGFTSACTVTVWGSEVSFTTSKIAAGYGYSIALNEDGTLWSWGYNSNGQLGDGTTINRSTPVAVMDMKDVKEVAAGNEHTVALKNDGTVWSWGYNRYYKLGYGNGWSNYTIPGKVDRISDVKEIAAGYDHTVVLKEDGTVWAWGLNNYGQLGDGTNSNLDSEIVQSMSGVTKIAAGDYHTAALASDGTVWTWGCNTNGQLGDGTTVSRYVPTQVANVSDIIDIEAGSYNTLALSRDGTIWAWGNYYGTTPVKIQNLTDVKSISSGYNMISALKNDGTVWDIRSIYSPVQLQNINDVTAISCGYNHIIVTKQDGTIWAWGDNQYGQLGDLTTNYANQAVQTLFGILPDTTPPVIVTTYPVNNETGVKTNTPITITFDETIITGDRFGLITLKDKNNNIVSLKSKTIDNNKLLLQPLNELSTAQSYTVYIPYNSIKDVFSNSFGQDYSFTFTPAVMKVSGVSLDQTAMTLWAGGANGRLIAAVNPFNATNKNVAWSSNNPDAASVDGNGVITPLTVGTTTITATTEDGGYQAKCTVTVKEIVAVSGIKLNKDKLIVAIGNRAIITASVLPLEATNKKVTWSSSDKAIAAVDSEGWVTGLSKGTAIITAKTEDGAFTAECTVDVVVSVQGLTLDKNFLRLVLGQGPTALIPVIHPEDATIKDVKWSSSNTSIVTVNANGEVTPAGAGTALITATTVDGEYTAECIVTVWEQQVDFVSTSVSAGGYHTLALNNDGTVWAWGFNDCGQLGDGTYINRNTPVKVKNISDVKSVSAGANHSSILKNDGTVWQWGYNTSIIPSMVQGLPAIKELAEGDGFTLALGEDGTVWAWGINECGQLGDGTKLSRNTPVQVLNLTDVKKISAGINHAMALKNDGTVWSWGYNWNGQLGDGTNNNSLLPIQVSGISGIKDIAAGGYHSTAVKVDGTVWSWGYWGTDITAIPKEIQGISNVTQVSAGIYYTMALRNDGTVWAWGDNGYGKLGNGTSNSQYIPVQVENLTDVILIKSGHNHSAAVKSDGTIWGWGYNEHGQIGDMSTINRSTPSQTLFGILQDNTSPEVISITPENNSSDVPVSTAITITFTEAVKAGDEFGMISLRDNNDRIVSLKKKSISGNTITLEPLNALLPSTQYTVTIPRNSVMDMFNNNYAGYYNISFLTGSTGTPSGMNPRQSAGFAMTYPPNVKVEVTVEDIASKRKKFIDEGALTTIRNNAILNRWWDPDASHWMKFTSETNENNKRYLSLNYWGTQSELLISKALIDFNDFRSMEEIVYKPILNTPPETAYPFVTDIYVSAEKEVRAIKVGAEKITVHVDFNRDMNVNIQPNVSFGPDMPTTDYTVHAINGGWADPRHWVGEFNITPITGDGYQFFRVTGAAAANDPWLVTGNDSERFRFEIITSGTEAMNLQAEGAEGKVKLSWTQNDFDLLAGYNVYRCETPDGTYEKINNALIPAEQKYFEDATVLPGKTYYYKFTVVKTDLTESIFSNMAWAAALDTIPPVISHTPLRGTAPGQDLRIYADVTDNVRIENVTLYYRKSGNVQYSKREMTKSDGNKYVATLEGSLIQVPGLEYYIEAGDGVSVTRSGNSVNPYKVAITDAPKITDISPKEGPETGGTSVIITGTNFKEGATVTFGGAVALDIKIESINRITCTSPKNSPSVVDVTVENTDGYRDTMLRAFTYKMDGVEVNIGNATANMGQIIEIPIFISEVTGFTAADIRISYDSEVLSAKGVRKGSVTSGFALEFNKDNPGKVILSMASGSASSGNGTLAYVEFEVLNTSKTSSYLNLEEVRLNSGTIAAHTVNGTFNISAVYSINGNIHYYSNYRSVGDVNLVLAGEKAYTAASNANGNYSITGVENGSYVLSANKSSDTAAISPYDASLILKASAGLAALNDYQRIAADVDNSGSVDSMDAAYVLRKVVGDVPLPFPGAGRIWAFVPGEIDYDNLNSDMNSQNFTAVLIGDVTGNWGGAADAGVQEITEAEFVIGNQTVQEDGTIIAPVVMNLSAGSLYGAEIMINYDSSLATAVAVTAGDLAGNAMLAYNKNIPGQIRIALAGSDAMSGRGILLNLIFKAAGEVPAPVNVQITFVEVNESGVPSVISQLLRGDVDGDNNVTSTDYSLLRMYIAGKIDHFPAQNGISAGDVDNDGAITDKDCELIKDFLLWKILSLPR